MGGGVVAGDDGARRAARGNPAAARRRAARILGRLALAGLLLALAATALAALLPGVAPLTTFVVRSGSMEPAVPTGALAVLVPVAAGDVTPGEVVAFEPPGRPGELVMHRVVEVQHDETGAYLVTKGDANPVRDSWRVPVAGDGWRLAFSIPYAGYAVGWAQSPAGRLALVVVPASLLALGLLLSLWRPRRGLPAARAA